MPKQPSKPGIPIPYEHEEPGTGRHRTCAVGRAAAVRTEQLAQRLADHIESDDDRIGGVARDVDAVDRKVAAVDRKVDVLDNKVDSMSNHVVDLRVSVARMTSAMDNISAEVAEQNAIKRVRVFADVETGKVEKITAIEDEADRKKARRAFWLKIAVVVVGIIGGAIGILIEHIR